MATLDSINERWEASKGLGLGKLAGKTKKLAINKLEVEPKVFQPRFIDDSDKTGVQNKEHVSVLVKRLEREGSLDPVLVLPVGDKAIVIDGHHRLEAYKAAKHKTIVVQIFDSNPHDAKLESGKENHKARLQMSSQERTQNAWNLVIQGMVSPSKWRFSEQEIRTATGASEGTIKSMRKLYKELISNDVEVPESWLIARTGLIDGGDRDWDAEMEAQVQRYRQALLKTFPKLSSSRKREAFALAIVSFNPQSTPEILRHILETDDGMDALEAREIELQQLKDLEF